MFTDRFTSILELYLAFDDRPKSHFRARRVRLNGIVLEDHAS